MLSTYNVEIPGSRLWVLKNTGIFDWGCYQSRIHCIMTLLASLFCSIQLSLLSRLSWISGTRIHVFWGGVEFWIHTPASLVSFMHRFKCCRRDIVRVIAIAYNTIYLRYIHNYATFQRWLYNYLHLKYISHSLILTEWYTPTRPMSSCPINLNANIIQVW